MPRILLPKKIEQREILIALDRGRVLDTNGPSVEIMLPRDAEAKFSVSGLIALANWLQRMKRQGTKVDILNIEEAPVAASLLGESVTEYISDYAKFKGDWLATRIVHNDDEMFSAVNNLCELVLRKVKNAQRVMPLIEWCVNEAVDNVLRHAGDGIPGCVAARIDPKGEILEVAISDSGRGILNSIRESHNPFNMTDAIQLAITRGVTRDPSVGQGFGLAGNVEIMEKMNGIFELTSENIRLRQKDGIQNFQELPFVSGTQVYQMFNLITPVNLEDTSVVGSSAILDWNYLNILREKYEDFGGIKVQEECVHVGGRGPARELRLKLQSLLDHDPELIVLNFEGVTNPASSFLDELLGRLVIHLGPENFHQRIRISNMSDLVERMAYNVIGDRVQRDDK